MKPEDVKELLWRRHAYNNAVTSLRAVFKKEIETKEAAGLGIEALRAREKEELDALLLKNEEENRERAKMRWRYYFIYKNYRYISEKLWKRKLMISSRPNFWKTSN